MFDIIEDKRNELAELCRQFHVRRLSLFGSSLTGKFDPNRSDLDFLVQFGPIAEGQYARTYFAFSEALEKLFGKPIDLIEHSAVRNPYVQREIDRTQQIVYGA